MTNYYTHSIDELGKLIQDQKVSPVALVQECLERIHQTQPKINAFITVLEESALEAAKVAEKEIADGKWRGPLHGIPVALKDMYDTAGIKTTAAFEHFANRVPSKDAAVVTKLKEAGAIIIGKTNMHTLAMGTTSLESYFGPVKNPWNTDFIAGGSSGGSSAAVAAGLCFATIDTDAIGSCRLPASCCGVVGYKCTWGKIDNSGILEGEQADPVILQLATVGIQARHVADVAVVAEVLGDIEAEAKTPKRIGIVSNFGADEALRTQFASIVNTLEKNEFELSEIAAPFESAPDMTAMERARQEVKSTLFADVDVLVLLTLASEVPRVSQIGSDPQALSPQNTFFVNYLGLPAITVPCGLDSNGLPVGLQIVGMPDADAEVLALAEKITSMLPAIEYPGI